MLSRIFILLHILQLRENLFFHFRDSFFVQFLSSQMLSRIFVHPYRQMQELSRVLNLNHPRFLWYCLRESKSLFLASSIQYNISQLQFWGNHRICFCQYTQDSTLELYHKNKYWNRSVQANVLERGIISFFLRAIEGIIWFYYRHLQSLS